MTGGREGWQCGRHRSEAHEEQQEECEACDGGADVRRGRGESHADSKR